MLQGLDPCLGAGQLRSLRLELAGLSHLSRRPRDVSWSFKAARSEKCRGAEKPKHPAPPETPTALPDLQMGAVKACYNAEGLQSFLSGGNICILKENRTGQCARGTSVDIVRSRLEGDVQRLLPVPGTVTSVAPHVALASHSLLGRGTPDSSVSSGPKLFSTSHLHKEKPSHYRDSFWHYPGSRCGQEEVRANFHSSRNPRPKCK